MNYDPHTNQVIVYPQAVSHTVNEKSTYFRRANGDAILHSRLNRSTIYLATLRATEFLAKVEGKSADRVSNCTVKL